MPTLQLEPTELSLLPYIDVSDPEETLALSQAITNRAVEHVLTLDVSIVQKIGIVGALIEREWWELPNEGGGFTQNLTLSKITGKYFTPPNVAWHIALETIWPEMCRSLDGGSSLTNKFLVSRILDPACGAGIFLACAVELLLFVFKELGKSRKVPKSGFKSDFAYRCNIAYKQLHGYEVSSRIFFLARKALASALGVESSRMRGLVHGDGLLLNCRGKASPKQYDFVLLNPPFGRLRHQEADLHRKNRRLSLSSNDRQVLASQIRTNISSTVDVVRARKRFRPALGGILDWQRLFLAQAIASTRSKGRIGALVPFSIAADRTAVRMREHLLSACSIERLEFLTEDAKFFPTVNQPIAILIATAGEKTREILVLGPSKSIDGLESQKTLVPASSFREISPSNIPLVPLKKITTEILDIIYRFPRIADNQHVLNCRGELDLTLGKNYIGDTGLPLIRGNDLERFRIRRVSERKGPQQFVNIEALGRISSSPKLDHILLPRVSGRQCAYIGKPRRMSFAVLGGGRVLANSCNYLIWNHRAEKRALLTLCGILNSSLMEWRFRLSSSNNHVNNYEIDDLPMLHEPCERIAQVTQSILEFYANEAFDLSSLPKCQLEAVLDATVFKAYGLLEHHIYHILSELGAVHAEAVLEAYRSYS